MIIVIVKNISMTNYYNYYTFTGRIFKQDTNTPWPDTDMIMYMSPGDMLNATCGCMASTSHWRGFYKNGTVVPSLSTSSDCNTETESCTNIFQTITEPLIVLCFTIHTSVFQYSLPVVINIQGII